MPAGVRRRVARLPDDAPPPVDPALRAVRIAVAAGVTLLSVVQAFGDPQVAAAVSRLCAS